MTLTSRGREREPMRVTLVVLALVLGSTALGLVSLQSYQGVPSKTSPVLSQGKAVATAAIRSNANAVGGNRWTNAFSGPIGRSSLGLAYDSAAGRVIMFGGVTAAEFPTDTW